MKTNLEIKNTLASRKLLKDFCNYIGMTQQAFYKRVKSDKLKDNLWGQYLEYCQDKLGERA